MADTGDYILVCVPNKQLLDDPSAKTKTYQEITEVLSDCAAVNKFHLPDLRTGTLERLMQAADSLSKVDSSIEQVIRKIERQLSEFEDGTSPNLLTVEDQPVLKYVEHFNWSSAKYPTGRQVDELVKVIVQQGIKLEEELKEGAAYLQDKRSTLASVQRRKEGNLTVVDLEDILTPSVLVPLATSCGRTFGETEYLKDVVVVVPRSLETGFLQKYEALADDMVGYGESGDRESVRGSPVVPDSAVKAYEDKDGFQLYIVNILKNFYDEFKRACLGNRFTVRDFEFSRVAVTSTSASEEGEQEKASLSAVKTEFDQAEQQLKRWCNAHYGEVFISWMHIKAIRLFVESCLRYGIPPNFSAVLIKSNRKGGEKRIRSKLLEAYGSLDSSGMMQASKEEIGQGGEDQVFPYVSLDISVFGTPE